MTDHTTNWRELLATGRYDELLTALGARTDAQAQLLRFQAHLARDDEQALVQWFDALPTKGLSAAGWAECSQQLHAAQWGDLALLASERALACDANSASLMSNHGFILRHCGQLDAAAHWLDRSLALAPDQGEAQLIRAELPAAAPAERLQTLSALLESMPAAAPDVIPLCYAAARCCEQLSQWDDVMHWLHRGAKAKRAGFQYSVERDEQMLAALARAPMPDLSESSGSQSDGARPLFIVGLPRTGSSLLEAHLARHPDITSAGELPHFNRALMQQFQAQFGRPPSSPAVFVQQMFSLDLAAVGERYRAATRRWQQGRWFIDKLPINALNLPLLLAALPEARVIHLARDARAMGFALYRQLFGRVYPFSYDLAEQGRYVQSYRQLMSNWQPQLPQVQWLEYETLVDDWPGAIDKLYRWLSLAPDVLLSAASVSTAFSATASASQIRESVHSHRTQVWTHVQAHLAPYLAQLQK